MNTSHFADAGELPYWLALIRAPKLGPALFQKFLTLFPRLSELFATPWQSLIDLKIEPALAAYLQNPAWRAVEQDLAWRQQIGNGILTWQDPTYPPLLRQIPQAPPVIYIQGDAKVLATAQLAIVGSRNPTPAGQECAFNFARALAACGLTITSGLALGIDAASHRGALNAKGLTIGVAGTGLDRIYPARHKELVEQVVEQGGAVISEFPSGTLPKAENFPRRNRLISGLSVGVLVVEAVLKSGSLITARFALEQGREVFAIPGSIHNPLARGCHALLRQGAKLVETTADILEELGSLLQASAMALAPTSTPHKKLDLPELDGDHAALAACIDFSATPIDALIVRSGLSAEAVSSMLTLLELQGYITAVPGGYVKNS
jgi:DNA processing protein